MEDLPRVDLSTSIGFFFSFMIINIDNLDNRSLICMLRHAIAK